MRWWRRCGVGSRRVRRWLGCGPMCRGCVGCWGWVAGWVGRGLWRCRAAISFRWLGRSWISWCLKGVPMRGCGRWRLGRWRWRAFEDVRLDGGLEGELAGLQERRLLLVEGWAEACLALGRHGELVPELRRLVAVEPLRERLWGQWMLALSRSGRQAEALAAYQQLRGRLVEELGIEPSGPVQQLQRQILRGEVALPPGRAGADRAGAVVVPRQLPPDIADFTGRDGALERLHARVRSGGSGSTALVITAAVGKAGVGKTTLAVHAAHQLRCSFPDGQLYVNLRGVEAQSLDP